MKKEFPFSEEEIKKIHSKILVISKVLDDFVEEITSYGGDLELIADFVSQKTEFSTLEILEVFEFQKKLKELIDKKKT